MYDVAIIGAGVVGTAIARQLSKYDIKVVVLESQSDVGVGATKANSGIIHAGYDPEPHTLMAKLNALGNAMFDELSSELSVPFYRNGSLVVAFDDEQVTHIQKLYKRGLENGIPGLEILSHEELLKKEPNINPEAKGALYAATAGIIDPMLLAISFMENAVMNGAELILNFEVVSIKNHDSIYTISSCDSSISAKYVINAAGVYSDDIHNMVAKPCFKILPKSGQYFLLDKTQRGLVNATIFPCPTALGKGILVTPTVHGNMLLGPSAEDAPDKSAVGTTDESLKKARDGSKMLVPKISVWSVIRTFTGIRAEPDIDDFVIGEADGAPNFINAAGIKSPGLTACPAIALYVADILRDKGLELIQKDNFNPIVKRKLLIELEETEQAELIAKNPLYGRVICRCENVTEGDIVDAIRRPIGATTLDGIKRRCRAGMGTCQGGFCSPKVQYILSRELSIPLENIMLDSSKSYILTGRTK